MPDHSLSGRALHTGVRSTVRVARRAGADDGQGLRFAFPGFEAPLTARDLATLIPTARRATVLTHPRSGARIRTPEHLLAAALFFRAAPLDIACDAEEIPGVDGSARPWFDLLAAASTRGALLSSLAPASAQAGGRRVGGEGNPEAFTSPPKKTCLEYDTDLTWDHAGPEGTLRAEPSDHFSVWYTLERGDFSQTFELADSADAPAQILPARTFIFWRDWQSLRNGLSSPLLGGADENSGLLLAETAEEFTDALAEFPQNAANAFPLLHPRAFRMEAEAARHKVLDLLGDLALNGLALPKLRLTIAGGGHALNHLLLAALRARASGRTDTTHEGNAP